MMELYKEFKFEAAHFLPAVSEDHKCRNMHGHSYRFTIFVKGEINTQNGWVMDLDEIKQAVIPVINQLDHKVLNEIEGLQNPTVENLAVWLWSKIHASLPLLSKISIAETATAGCTYEGKQWH